MEVYQGSNYSLSYSVYGDPQNQTVLLIPPGEGRSRHFKPLSQILSKKYFVMALDLPGIGKTHFPKYDISNIAITLIDFFEKQKIQKPIIIAESYGTCLAILLSQEIEMKKLVLIGGGDFFNLSQKVFLNILFFPTRFSSFVRGFYSQFITQRLKTNDLSDLTDRQLKIINSRWHEIFKYQNPDIKNREVGTLIINSKKDKVVQKKSIVKIKAIFPNHQFLLLDCGHFEYLQELSKNNFEELLKFIS